MSRNYLSTLMVLIQVCCIFSAIGLAQPDTLRILPSSGGIGSSGNVVPVYLANSVDVTGIQFTLGNSSGFLTVEQIETSERTSGFSTAIGNNQVLLYDLQGRSIASGKGPVLNLFITVAEYATEQVDTLSFIKSPILSDTQARSIEPIVAASGMFTIEEATNVELRYFTANISGNSVTLRWGINSSAHKTFEIHRSRNGRVFSQIAVVKNTGQEHGNEMYQYEDMELEEGEYYYKLFERSEDHPTTELGTVNVLVLMPRAYVLEQNYPNPFTSTNGPTFGGNATQIGFSVKESGHVRISVFDLLGKQVATVVDREFERGKYSVEFEAEGLRSGVYFYKMEVNNFSSTKKMLIVR